MNPALPKGRGSLQIRRKGGVKALILAAGYGTRLYPLTKKHPKALLAVAGRPILDYIVEKIARVKEISGIVVVTNDKFFPQFQAWLRLSEAAPSPSGLWAKKIEDKP